MPLGPDEEDKLREGQLVWADVRRSFELYPAGEHPAILIDPDETIREVVEGKVNPPEIYVIVISHDTTIDPPETRLPVFFRWGLTGYLQGRWVVNVPLQHINKLGRITASKNELKQIDRLIKESRRRPSDESRLRI